MHAHARLSFLVCACLAGAGLIAPVPAHADDDDAPWSEIRVGGVADADLGQYDVIVMAINGSMDFRDRSVYPLAPGRHHFRIASTKRGRSGEMTARPFVIEAQPCVRYELVADHGPAGEGQGWRIAVRAETPIKSCVKKYADRLTIDAESATAGP